jgi:hypothetical protein
MIPVGAPEARYKPARLKTEAAATGQMRKVRVKRNVQSTTLAHDARMGHPAREDLPA